MSVHHASCSVALRPKIVALSAFPSLSVTEPGAAAHPIFLRIGGPLLGAHLGTHGPPQGRALPVLPDVHSTQHGLHRCWGRSAASRGGGLFR